MVHLSTHHVVITKRLRVRIPLAAIIFSIACHALALGILSSIPIPIHNSVDRRASLQFEAGENAFLLEINPIPVPQIPEAPAPSTNPDERKRDLTTYLQPALVEDTDDEIPIEVKPTFTQNNDLPTPVGTSRTSRKTISRTMNYAADRARFWSSQISQLIEQLRDQIRARQVEPTPEMTPPEKTIPTTAKQLSAKQPVKPKKTKPVEQPKMKNANTPPKHIPRPAASPGVQGTTVSAKIINNPAPQYPPLSRRLNEEGLVVLKIQVRVDGSIGKIVVLEEPGYPRLVKAALDAVEKSVFQPALNNGKPVEDTIVLRFRFKLTDDL